MPISSEEIAKKESSGSRKMGKFDVDCGEIGEFKKWLTGIEGKKRSEREARQIAVDVSKAINHCTPYFSWDALLDAKKLQSYLDLCEQSGIGASGLTTKCNRIETALNFVKLERLNPTDYSKLSEIEIVQQRVKSWKRSYRVEKKKATKLRQSLELDNDDGKEMALIVDCLHMWDDFEAAVRKVGRNPPHVLKTCTSAIAALLMYKSAERPTAVIGATLHEFERAKHVEDIWVMKVANHKTCGQGAASMTMSEEDHIRVGHYVQILRPQIDPLGQKEELLVLPGPLAIVRMNKLMTRLGSIYSLEVPTATEYRKKLATVAARSCSSADVRVLSHQMSHSVETHKRNYMYEELHGDKFAYDQLAQQLKAVLKSKPKS